ncbi:MAG: hypothetical protein ACREI7_06825 [Myxococcota bacterium]
MPATPTPPIGTDSSWDEIDQASWESFPASDPPAWNHHRVIGNPEDKLPETTQPPGHAALRRRARLRVAGVALALAGVAGAAIWFTRVRGCSAR